MVKVSCILPIYNAEKYLDNTLTLLLNQTLYEIEVICINDCSSDNTWNILLEKQKCDRRIILINEMEHKGAATCRNIGFGKAQGEFVIFLDADDYFFYNMLENAYNLAIIKEAELVVFGYEKIFISIDEDGNEITSSISIHKNKYEELFNNEINVETIKKVDCYAWNKMVKRDLLKDKKIFFQDVPSNNDMFFAIAVTLQAKKTVISDEVLLKYYCGHTNSLTLKRLNKKNYLIAVYNRLLAFVNENQICNVSSIDMLNYILDHLASCFTNDRCTKCVSEDTYKLLLEDMFLINTIKEAIKQKKLSKHNMIFGKAILDKACVIGVNNYIYYLDCLLPILDRAKIEGKKIALWGCGVLGKRFLDMLNNEKIQIDYVIDSDKNKQGTQYGTYLICDYNSIKEKVNMILVLHSKYIDDIRNVAVGKSIVDVSKL